MEVAEPFFIGGKAAHGQTADDIMDALLRDCHFPLDDVGEISRLFSKADIGFIFICTDRCSANDVVVRWLLARLQNPEGDRFGHLVLHAEYCLPHALAIAKSRYVDAKQKGQHVSSLSKLLRDGRFKSALIDEVVRTVKSSLAVKHEQRPPIYAERAARLVDALCGTCDEAFLWTTRKDGTRVEKSWLQAVRKHLEVADLEPVA